MFRVIDEKDCGKTKKLLKECQNNNGLFICRHPNRVSEKCKAYNIPIVNAIGYDEFLNLLKEDYKNISSKNIYVDELEELLLCITPFLKGYSISK